MTAFTEYPSYPDSPGLTFALEAAGINCYWRAGVFYVSDLTAAQALAASYNPLPFQAQQLLAGGFPVTSATNSAINGTYPVDAETRADLQAEMISLMKNSTFADGTTSLILLDAGGAQHAFDVTHAETFITQMGVFVAALKKIAITGSGTLPTVPVAIG